MENNNAIEEIPKKKQKFNNFDYKIKDIIFDNSISISNSKIIILRFIGFGHSIASECNPNNLFNIILQYLIEFIKKYQDFEFIIQWDGDLWAKDRYSYIIKLLMDEYKDSENIKFVAFKKFTSCKKLLKEYKKKDYGIMTFGYLSEIETGIKKWIPTEPNNFTFDKKMTIIGIPEEYINHWSDITKYSYEFNKNLLIYLFTLGGGDITKTEIENNNLINVKHFPVKRINKGNIECCSFYNWENN